MADETTSLVTTAAVPARTEVPLVQGIGTNYQAGGMTYLQMLRRLRQECGVSGSDPASVTNLPGEMARLSNYVKQAWLEIQTMHPDWQFMRQPVSFTSSANQPEYSSQEMLISSFGSLKTDSFRNAPANEPYAENFMYPMEYDDFRNTYGFGTNRLVRARPIHFAVTPQGNIILGPTPDAQYIITGESYAMPTELANNDDRPACPSQFHMAIVYKAMMLYGHYEAAPEVMMHGTSEFNKLIARMAAAQLPKLQWGAPLV